MRQALKATALLAAFALLTGCGKNFTAYALTSTDEILKFDTKTPATIESTAQVSGLSSGETVVSMAYDPGGTLYCITNDSYVCTLDPDTGAASIVGVQITTTTLSTPTLGVDPTVSQLRIINSGYNLLVSESGGGTGNVVDATKLAYDSNDANTNTPPNPAAITYSNPSSGATTSTLYVLDAATGTLDYVGSTNVDGPASGDAGDLHTVGSTGIIFSNVGGFAIEQQSGDAYAALQPTGGQVSLYTIDLSNGSSSNVGELGDGTQSVMALAIPPGQ